MINHESLIQVLSQIEKNDLQPEQVEFLVSNAKELYDLPIYLANEKNNNVENSDSTLRKIMPFCTIFTSESTNEEVRCVHIFMDEQAYEKHIDHDVFAETHERITMKFGWLFVEFSEQMAQQDKPFMYVFHFLDDSKPIGLSTAVITGVEVKQIQQLFTMNAVFNNPDLSLKIWRSLSWNNIRQKCYDFSLMNQHINRLWLFAFGTMLYVVVEGDDMASRETLESLQTLVKAALDDVSRNHMLDVVVSDYHSRSELVDEGIQAYGSLLFDKNSSHNLIKRWFNVRRQTPILIAPID